MKFSDFGIEQNKEHDKLLRTEIIESQKTQADFLKWKLITVATVASASFGFVSSGSSTIEGSKLLICLIPLICAYVDLTSLHIMIRIITIGAYLKMSGNAYEKFIFAVRGKAATDPFVFEAGALHGSSLVFNLIIVILSPMLAKGNFCDECIPSYLNAYLIAGSIGMCVTILLCKLYILRATEVIQVAELSNELVLLAN